MGILDTLSGIFGGSSSQVGVDAANQQNTFINRAIAQLKDQSAPFTAAGEAALPSLIQGASIGGLDERLSEIFDTETFQRLVEERARGVEGQLAAGGLTRSGTALSEAASIPTDIGLALEGLLSGRQSDLAFGSQAAGSTAATNIANLLSQQGQNVSSGIITDAQTRASGATNLVNIASTAARIFFSDPSLKENVQPVAPLGDLTLYEWDWIPETKGTMVADFGTTGFMADEVEIKYPQHVRRVCGLMVIDYKSLLEEMESKKWQH